MPQDLKISEIPEKGFSNFTDITDGADGTGEPSMYVPVA
jgi:hypothetical protein